MPKKAQKLVIPSYNPATGEVLAEIPLMGKEEVQTVYETSRNAQAIWGGLSTQERCKLLKPFRDALVENAENLAHLISKENGKTLNEALFMEIFPILDLASYFIKEGPRILSPSPIPLHLLKHRKSYIHYAPLGVVGNISPWNFPLAIGLGETIMALVAGNTVIQKPSEFTPLIALETKRIFDETVPAKDAFQIITGDGRTGALLTEIGVDKIVFTGSVATGKKVAEACARQLIPYTLELGGKCAAIITDDINLERTANSLVWGSFANSGQVCASVDRVYAHRDIYHPLLDLVLEKTAKIRQGDPLNCETDMGAITIQKQIEVAESQIKDAVEKGARIAAGGQKRFYGSGMFFPPTILTDVDHSMKVMREETFGPIMNIMKVDSDFEALELANDSHLGLIGYVFCKSTRRAKKLAEELQCGTVMTNDVLATYGAPETPWSGLKKSGIGKVHSDDGLRDLCQKRHVNHEAIPLPSKEIWYYPYSKTVFDLTLKGMPLLFKSKLEPLVKKVADKVFN